MQFRRSLICVFCVLCGLVAVPALGAQAMDHSKMTATEQAAAPPSQAAFATIADIVKKLKADPTTDWSKVNLEALRQHLIDMDNVVMRAAVVSKNVDGGLSMDITGTGNVAGAITRMVTMHAAALTDEGVYVAKSSAIDGGVRLVVTAKTPSDAKAVAMVRGLGFAGLLTEGDHHAVHHLLVAKGEPMMHQHKP
jgi:hypothetical protein